MMPKGWFCRLWSFRPTRTWATRLCLSSFFVRSPRSKKPRSMPRVRLAGLVIALAGDLGLDEIGIPFKATNLEIGLCSRICGWNWGTLSPKPPGIFRFVLLLQRGRTGGSA